jgi:hypothetical protein
VVVETSDSGVETGRKGAMPVPRRVGDNVRVFPA